MNNKQNISLIIKLSIVLILAALLVAGGTFAYWSWVSDANKSVGFNTIEGVEDYIVYDAGDSHFVGDFVQTSSFCNSTSTTLSVKKTSEASDIKLVNTIYMDINAIGSSISSSSSVYWVVTRGNNSISCTSGVNGLSDSSVINYGTFNGKTADSSYALTSNVELEITTTTTEYTVWIWIQDDSGLTSGETVDTNIWSQIDMLDNVNSES